MIKNQCIVFSVVLLATTIHTTKHNDYRTVPLACLAYAITQNHLKSAVQGAEEVPPKENAAGESSGGCIEPSLIVAPAHLKDVKLRHNDDGFQVVHEGKYHKVPSCRVEKLLRNITPKELKSFLKHGYISLKQNNSDMFFITAKIPFGWRCYYRLLRNIKH
jgi:hypothetical protein